jgi:protein phosphatase
VLANAVGGSKDDLRVELHQAELAPGDILLLCTDGLTKHVSDPKIEKAIEKTLGNASVEQCVRELIDTAKRGGGSDNITVVAARYR